MSGGRESDKRKPILQKNAGSDPRLWLMFDRPQAEPPDPMVRVIFLMDFKTNEGGSAEPTRDKNMIGMYRRTPPLLCGPGWVV